MQWKSKLSDFFYGVEQLSVAQVPDHSGCEFGRWLYGAGLQEFSAYSEMKRIEVLHKEFHKKIKQLIQMPEEKRKGQEGREALATFKSECDVFVNLLESVEEKAKKESI
ncbi:MAG: CZB domain-containing protein [Candidatus Electrothrix scaldis]|nr:MAG: CZB domain-containing protein [Candidatus Electrothrix sp. GW3-3]